LRGKDGIGMKRAKAPPDNRGPYGVKWEIDIEADSPRHAAVKALKIRRDRNSMAMEPETLIVGMSHHGPNSKFFGKCKARRVANPPQ
jgi:hypothetical protein